jgi:RHH-type transcriptional regulator, proline utilization regulon repressor / proline dehydrogenase / delta 1-pyrroline-5-carboxylate dehydrogenase
MHSSEHLDRTRFTPPLTRSPLRDAIGRLTRTPEPELLPGLIEQARLSPAQGEQAQALALRIARGVRERSLGAGRAGMVQGLLQEFALSSQEGVALMCLAEALLRIPDAATRDALIRDKIAPGNWQQHLGQSASLFVNAAAWGLLLTGKLVATHSDVGLTATLRRAVARGGEPLVRQGVLIGMRLMGEQFVAGETIEEALANAKEREAQGFRYSYDMLGEAALTGADARRYFAAYEQAIHAIGGAAAGRGIVDGPGISIKLSALHPRYARSQLERVRAELYPALLQLVLLARHHDIGLNIDAEESERLELSLELLERLCFQPELAGWDGIGFVIQAYQKRCPAVVDYLVDLARRSRHRLMVRLVKGAYWDSEIKRAQLDGQDGYPVYTRKSHTDVAYIACARQLLAAPDAVFPQFATHNAHTLAAVHTLAGPGFTPGQYEFQCLHGMGEPLYEQVVGPVDQGQLGRPCRVYAPVGTHDTLLAYLVRRLLENGANTSFVNRIADRNLALEELVEDPVRTVQKNAAPPGMPHPAIPLPRDLYGAARANSRGLDLADEHVLERIGQALADAARAPWRAEPMLENGGPQGEPRKMSEGPGAPQVEPPGHPQGDWQPVINPADFGDTVGHVREATLADVDRAVAGASLAASSWAAVPPAQRAARLDAAADRLEAQTLALLVLLVREAGKTIANAVAEVREAVDFLRYCAAQVRRDFDNATHVPLGPVVCISPWNFPLAIFTGQVAAALAAGNTVLAKPAEQTPLIAAAAVRALHAAGIPRGALQLLPGQGESVGAALVEDPRVNGVLFTGSTEVARLLQRSLSRRLTAAGQGVPLIAETGGQNAMLVDSSALAEQAVADIVSSAFDSAGQRCSALRLLCVQDDVAPRLIEMLKGAVQELQIGDPRRLATDIGPSIDAPARAAVERHVAAMQARGRSVWRPNVEPRDLARGHFVAPALIEIDSVTELEREVFGPVLHVLSYPRERLAQTLAAINATGYGLTQGVHTRIDETVSQVLEAARAGNVYVNRNIVGAVVGVQPFGGEGLSGTGPKAGGPLYLLRLLAHRPGQAARLAVARSSSTRASAARSPAPTNSLPLPLAGEGRGEGRHTEHRGLPPALIPALSLAEKEQDSSSAEALAALRAWALAQGWGELAASCDQAVADSPVGDWLSLPGPTGEANLYAVLPRAAVLCLVGVDAASGGFESEADSDHDRLNQLAAVLAVGARAVWPAQAQALHERLPAAVRERVSLARDWAQPGVHFDAVLQHGRPEALLATAGALAQRPGAIVGLIGLPPGETRVPLERLVIERSLSINTAAAGGNASLMTIG